ncbi:MAG: LysR family transcriptional regulator [Candidatus Babeliales bacterium]
MNWLNLHHLKYFLIIAEEGSLTKASKKLLIGQPALSAQLKQLEDHLGQKLFDRVGKKFQITQAGEFVLKYAKAIKDLEDELVLNLPHATDFVKKEIFIAAQEVVPKSVLANILAKINLEKGLKLKVTEGSADDLFSGLVEGKFDLFIGNSRPFSATKEMIYLSLGKEPVTVWGDKTYLGLKKNFPQSLQGQSFLLPGLQSPVRHDFEKFMLEQGWDFSIPCEAQDTALLKELSARGQGLVLVGNESAKSWVKSNKLIKIGTLPGIYEEYWLGMVKRSVENTLLKSIIKRVKS